MNLIRLTHEAPTVEQLKQQHIDYISGSQVHEILTRPWDNLRKLCGVEPLESFNAPNAEIHMETGVYQEPHIMEAAKHFWPEIFKDVKTDKRTYHVEDTPFALNIDGYIGTDIENVEAVVEIKSTTEKDLSGAKDRGWIDQVKFYCMCLGATRAYIVGMCASRYKLLTLEFTKQELNELKKRLLEYDKSRKQALVTGDYTLLDGMRIPEDEIQEIELEDSDQIERLADVEELQRQEREIRKQLETFKDNWKEIYGGENVVKWRTKDGSWKCIQTKVHSKSSTDWSGVINDLMRALKVDGEQAKTVQKIIDDNTNTTYSASCSSIKKYKG